MQGAPKPVSTFKFNIEAAPFTPRSLPASPTGPVSGPLSWADRVKRAPAAVPAAKAGTSAKGAQGVWL